MEKRISMHDRIILAIDELALEESLNLVSQVGHLVYAVKIHILYDLHGPGVVERLRKAGARRVWVDAKLHDIPNTVRLRAQAIVSSGADIVSVHAAGHVEMMKAAIEGGTPAEIFAITVLTSLSEAQAYSLHGQSLEAAVLSLARLAKEAGMHGVVCSPKEVAILTGQPELSGLQLIVPGVRSAGKDAGDQRRVGTPAAAILNGASRLVIGRQITQAADPFAVLQEIVEEISQAAASMQKITS